MDEAVWETMWLWVSQALQEMLAHLKMCHMLDTLLWTCCTLKILLRVQPDYIYYWFYFDNLTNQIREKFVRLMFWYNLQTWSSKFGLRPICHRPDSMYLTVIRRRAHSPNCQMYLSKWQNVFVQIAKCICPNCKCICPTCKCIWLRSGDEQISPSYYQLLLAAGRKWVADLAGQPACCHQNRNPNRKFFFRYPFQFS